MIHSDNLSKESSFWPLETFKNPSQNEGIVWEILSIGKKELSKLRSNIEIKQLKKEISQAKTIEQQILEYLRLDNYLGIPLDANKNLEDLVASYPIEAERFETQSNFFYNIFALYFLRNPHINMSEKKILSWINEKKNIQIEFSANNEKHEYFIRDIRIVDSPESQKK